MTSRDDSDSGAEVAFDREYRTVDKTCWRDGPWRDEPDKAQWVDERTGLDCLIVRGPVGALCGYVGVGPDHPWHGRDYSEGTPTEDEPDGYYAEDCPALALDVHGGITYAARCREGDDESVGVCHVPLPGRPTNVWWFGFDCAHAWDIAPGADARAVALGAPWPWHAPDEVYRTIGYVRAQCRDLAAQLAAQKGRVLVAPEPKSP